MVYLLLTMELPRNKVKEAWKVYQDKVLKFDKESVEKVGGKYIGYWCTEYGKIGEINFMVAYPSLDVREEFMEKFWEVQTEELKKGLAEWVAYVPHATVKVMRPLPGSPLQ